MLHVTKGLVTPRCTAARILVLLIAGTTVVGCSRNGGNPASDATSAAAPTASAGDQEPISAPEADKAPAETAPVLRGDRWYAPGQRADSEHPYGFFEKDPQRPCILVSPRGAVWLFEDTPVNRISMSLERGDRAMGGRLVIPQSFVSLSNDNFASSIDHAHPGEVEFVLAPVASEKNPTVAQIFGLNADGRYFKLDFRPSAFQRGLGIEREITEEALKPGCSTDLGQEVIAYQFELSERLGGSFVDAVQQALQQPVEAAAAESQEGTPGITKIGNWMIFDATSGMAAAIAKDGSELKFLARSEATERRQGGAGLFQVMCLRPAGKPWVFYIFNERYAGEVLISFDGGPSERFQHPWNPPTGVQFDAESTERLIQRLRSARQLTMKGQTISSALHGSKRQWTEPATFNVDGFNELLGTHIAACPAPEARALAAAYAPTQGSIPPAGATRIPEGFLGTWAADLEACAVAEEIGAPPDPGVAIDSTSINRYENYCAVRRLRSEAPDLVVADVTCNAEGESFDNTVTLVRVGEKLRIDGAGDYLRCPERHRSRPTETSGAAANGAAQSLPTSSARSDVTTPSIARATQPEYPPSARRLGEEGRVFLTAYVLPDGTPAEVRIQKSSGSQALDDAALTDVQRNWRFRPGRENGQPAAMWHTFAVTFRLTDDEDAEPAASGAARADNPCTAYPAGPRAYAQRRIQEARGLIARGGHCADGWMSTYVRALDQFDRLDAHLDPQNPTWCAVALGMPLEVWQNQLPMCR